MTLLKTTKKQSKTLIGTAIFIVFVLLSSCSEQSPRAIEDFNANWEFFPGDDSTALTSPEIQAERILNLPHDWSIEGPFNKYNPSTIAGGALPTGIGWYRKTFTLPENTMDKTIYVDFDGVYRNSEVWINGHYLGLRPNGYISFRYDLTPYVIFNQPNQLVVRVDNSLQPNSRWYTGSGIYRNVHLVITGNVHIDQWGTFISTSQISEDLARLKLALTIRNNTDSLTEISVKTKIYNASGKKVSETTNDEMAINEDYVNYSREIQIEDPILWSIDNPYLYKAVTEIRMSDQLIDSYETKFGIRYFEFDIETGFYLNGRPLKILGVNNHHDLGALGSAVNKRAIERQLEILKDMGCNAIRTAHNPPAPELLDLCDKMGFLVMDEAFDCWKKKKMKQDYSRNWDDWHERDLADFILRDRNHPSVIMWSIGNEIREQFDSTGTTIARELVDIVKELDPTRPVTCALTENAPEKNYIYQSHALDILGFNYKQEAYEHFPETFPDEVMIASENMSALASRGHYDMPSDSLRKWPPAYNAPFDTNADYTVSAYDQVCAYWGSTHEQTWKVIKKLDFVPGVFVWSGFDFLGEPVPYNWPARSSYYGIIDLAGFPKDAYYMYQSEWTDKPVLHIFPHWNWNEGDTIDVWVYYNDADEVELYLNEESLGRKSKGEDEFHVRWRVPYVPGTLQAVSLKNDEMVLLKEIKTAGEPAKIELIPDRKILNADGKDLSFVTVRIQDKEGTLVPGANNLVNFEISGPGFIAGVDNGYQASHEPFKADFRKAYNGLCLAIIQSQKSKGKIVMKAASEGLEGQEIIIQTK
ncbi:MAG: DUF4982 domain-containing protein [Bacteroidales bacterium]|nr:DUF4982 domain-containing protein [Bacteroidales bacterium]